MDAPTRIENAWLTVEQIAAYLQVSKETVYRWLDRGSIPAAKIGRQWRFKTDQVDDWVEGGLATENHRTEKTSQKKKAKRNG